MSFRRWSSVLEHHQLVELSAYAAMLLEEMSDSSSSSASSSSSSSSSSSANSSTLSEELATVLHAVNEIHHDIEGGMEDETIQWRGKRLIVEDLSDDDAISHFRFRKKHLQEVANKLWPRLQQYLVGSKAGVIFEGGKYSCPYETLLLMVLFRFSRPRRIRKEMEGFFGIRRSKMSAGIKAMVNAMHSLALLYLDNPKIFHHKMPYYANRIFNKCGLAETVWGFIDGTLRKTCRPSYFQKLLYSGHKRCHGIKFQSIVTPDGLFACMYGPITGNRHDSFMLSKSQLLNKLRAFMPEPLNHEQPGNVIYSLYGDPAYPQSVYVFGGYRNPPQGSPQAAWNTQMSKVREVVEWGFANITTNWSFLDFKAAMMIFQSPIAKYYMIAAFLVNLRTCFYGNQTMDYFDSTTMSLDEYLSLIDNEDEE
jgi:DDE superfamily endonuclease